MVLIGTILFDRVMAARPSRNSRILHDLPLAELSAGGQLVEAVRTEARRRRVQLRTQLKLSSCPQMARAVAGGGVAAVLSAVAAEALPGAGVTAVSLPFLDGLARDVALIWNRQMVEVRPILGTVARLLSAAWCVIPPPEAKRETNPNSTLRKSAPGRFR